jgi:ribosomal protein L36
MRVQSSIKIPDNLKKVCRIVVRKGRMRVVCEQGYRRHNQRQG